MRREALHRAGLQCKSLVECGSLWILRLVAEAFSVSDFRTLFLVPTIYLTKVWGLHQAIAFFQAFNASVDAVDCRWTVEK